MCTRKTHAAANNKVAVVGAAVLYVFEHGLLQLLVVHTSELDEPAGGDPESEQEGDDLARAELDPSGDESFVHHVHMLGRALLFTGNNTVATTASLLLRGARVSGSSTVVIGFRLNIGVSRTTGVVLWLLSVSHMFKPVVPLLPVVLHARHLNVRPNRLGEVIVAVAAEGLRGLDPGQELLGGEALINEAAGVQLQEGQRLDELGRGHGGHPVVLAQVACGPPVEPLGLLGLVDILCKAGTTGG